VGDRQVPHKLTQEVGMWTRLCVDLDGAGNVCGASYEHHDADGVVVSIGTHLFAPFDTPAEVLDSLISAHRDEYGVHGTLF
jgi:hypothetical protein